MSTSEVASIDPPEQPGVYLIEIFNGWVKIGRSENINRRLKELNRMSPTTPRLLAVLDGDPEKESSWHARFGTLRRKGEWFIFGPQMAEALQTL